MQSIRPTSESGPVLPGPEVDLGERAIVGGWATENTISDDGFLMTEVHINHDGQAGDDATVSAMAVTAGHVVIEHGVNLGLGVVVHQRPTVLADSMIGIQAAVTCELPPYPPYAVSTGVPARPSG